MPKLLTAAQRRAVQQAIVDCHLLFAVEVLGPDAVSKSDYDRLRRSGKLGKPMQTDAATAATALGTMTGQLAPGDAEKMAPAAFWRMMREAPAQLSPAEEEAVAIARDRLGEHIKGLGNKLDAATGHLLIDADDKLRKRRLKTIRREVSEGIAGRESAREVAQRLRDATKDVKRNWLQIAQTEMHNCVEEGKALALMHAMPEGDPLVYKRPRPDACPFCKLLYLMPDKKTPRVFKLSELMANGTNVGRKAKRPLLRGKSATEYKAVLGAMHPWCQCQLHHMPSGMGFNTAGQIVYLGTKKSIVVESLDKALLNHRCGHDH